VTAFFEHGAGRGADPGEPRRARDAARTEA
jgi:hypothetical protein